MFFVFSVSLALVFLNFKGLAHFFEKNMIAMLGLLKSSGHIRGPQFKPAYYSLVL